MSSRFQSQSISAIIDSNVASAVAFAAVDPPNLNGQFHLPKHRQKTQ